MQSLDLFLLRDETIDPCLVRLQHRRLLMVAALYLPQDVLPLEHPFLPFVHGRVLAGLEGCVLRAAHQIGVDNAGILLLRAIPAPLLLFSLLLFGLFGPRGLQRFQEHSILVVIWDTEHELE